MNGTYGSRLFVRDIHHDQIGPAGKNFNGGRLVNGDGLVEGPLKFDRALPPQSDPTGFHAADLDG